MLESLEWLLPTPADFRQRVKDLRAQIAAGALAPGAWNSVLGTTLVLKGVSKDLLATMDAEHETMAAALGETRTAMDALARTAGLEECKAASAACRDGSLPLEHFEPLVRARMASAKIV